ncbi:MAG: hypothetical protein ACLQMH_08925 [Solirubrobacteraceae bacterium]
MFAGAIGAIAPSGMTPTHGGPPKMTEVAKLLGLSSSQLAGQLQSGKTLNTLATEKGVSSSELIKTIESELATNRPAGAPELSASALTQMATNIANGTPPARSGFGHHHSGSGGRDLSSETLAGSLGIEPSVLLEGLQSGNSLQSLLEEAGYTREGTSAQASSTGGVAFNQQI